MATLLELAERCEKAEGPDRKLDAEVARATGWKVSPGGTWWQPPGGQWGFVLRAYTASIDAALTLLPEGWFGALDPIFFEDGESTLFDGICIRPQWRDWRPNDADAWLRRMRARAATPALALCAAALRARAASEPSQ